MMRYTGCIPIVTTTVLFSLCVQALAQDPSLQVKPNRCIALHQGQSCYQKLTFTWQTPSSGNYCLFQRSTAMPIICWQGDSLSRYRHKFKASRSEDFYIFHEEEKSIIHTISVNVAWVYKSSKKVSTGWRLF